MPNWDADLYLRFAEERTRPALDLLDRIAIDEPRQVIDLGCGPGNSTALLRRRWPGAMVTGLDNSPEMIAAARQSSPDGRWILADLRTWTDADCYDVIYSNAALQWTPDHGRLLPRIMSMVAAGGALAVQVPRHVQSPVHQLMLEISQRGEWRERMAPATSAITVETPAFYYDLLQPLARRIDLWETEYQHVLENPAAIVTWIRGTGLRPFLEALDSDQHRHRFEELLLRGVEGAYPRHMDGRVLFPFRRLFFIASK